MSKDFASIPFEDPRFWSKVDQHSGVFVLDTECWLWTASDNGNGYPVYYHYKNQGYAHRYSWEQANSQLIPEGLEIDHLCRNTRCIRPDHLEAVTHKINNLRSTSWAAVNAIKTHCPRGHEYTEENTRIRNGSRYCKVCDREIKLETAREEGVREIGSYRPHNAKLNFEIAEEIRAKYVPRKYPQSKLAKEYGVAQTVISAIIRKKIWKKKLDDE